VKDGRYIRRRGADDSQNFGRSGLLLQRFRNLAITRFELLEQPHVFDRDNTLCSKGLQQVDLFVREWGYLHAPQDDGPYWLSFT
jgi:hypothetical protein